MDFLPSESEIGSLTEQSGIVSKLVCSKVRSVDGSCLLGPMMGKKRVDQTVVCSSKNLVANELNDVESSS